MKKLKIYYEIFFLGLTAFDFSLIPLYYSFSIKPNIAPLLSSLNDWNVIQKIPAYDRVTITIVFFQVFLFFLMSIFSTMAIPELLDGIKQRINKI